MHLPTERCVLRGFLFFLLFPVHGQLISSSNTTFCLSTTIAPIDLLLLPSSLHALTHPRRCSLVHSCTLALEFQASTRMAHSLLSTNPRAAQRIELCALRPVWSSTCSALGRHIHSKHEGRSPHLFCTFDT